MKIYVDICLIDGMYKKTLPMNFLKNIGKKKQVHVERPFFWKKRQAEMPLVCDSCDSPADDPTESKMNQKMNRIRRKASAVVCRNWRFTANSWKLCPQNWRKNTGNPGNFAPQDFRSPGQYYGGCQHRSAGVVPIWPPMAPASKCWAAPERWLWPSRLETSIEICINKVVGKKVPRNLSQSWKFWILVSLCLPLLSTLGHTIVGKAIKIQPQYLSRWDISETLRKLAS